MSREKSHNPDPDHDYAPEPRLVDNPDELRRLYVEQDLSIREIAAEHSTVEKTTVWRVIDDYGINDDSPQCDTGDSAHDTDGDEPLRPFADHPAIAGD